MTAAAMPPPSAAAAARPPDPLLSAPLLPTLLRFALPNMLAMELAGLGKTTLFAGSWSEWCSDPSRPVERG